MHPFHDGQYSGVNTIPVTTTAPVPAAALVLHHDRMVSANPNPVREVRLVPVQAVDFYPRRVV